eukprot:CAMPEP_0174719678 /NCGR_PEP_ID=MMETSP1094-20130205/31704_1 /TAXON_ID=156173 /ORGANISM="Chrysochromulina brevifilum, Strain UTEX LB 985" /LENGTH=150 /DNA_ID=CAMNT_0015920021 /DNA_START=15 /DNA_END=467 /DNA_ORIENTATION=+
MTTDDSTPLMIALYLASRHVSVQSSGPWLHAEAAGHLLRAGASLHTLKDQRGRTALQWAPTSWHAALEACARGEYGAAELVTRLRQLSGTKPARKKGSSPTVPSPQWGTQDVSGTSVAASTVARTGERSWFERCVESLSCCTACCVATKS